MPLDEGVLRADGAYRYLAPDGSEQVESGFIRPAYSTRKHRDWVMPLVKRLTDEGQQVIVFRATKAETRFVAEYLANSVGLPPAQSALDRLPASDPSVASGYLRRVLQAGVGFHNSDLDRDERHILEEEFRAPDSALRVLRSDHHFGDGLNTPASSVVCTSQYANQPPGVVQHTCIGRGRSGLTARYVRAGRPWRSVACRRPSAPPLLPGLARLLVPRERDTSTRIGYWMVRTSEPASPPKPPTCR